MQSGAVGGYLLPSPSALLSSTSLPVLPIDLTPTPMPSSETSPTPRSAASGGESDRVIATIAGACGLLVLATVVAIATTLIAVRKRKCARQSLTLGDEREVIDNQGRARLNTVLEDNDAYIATPSITTSDPEVVYDEAKPPLPPPYPHLQDMELQQNQAYIQTPAIPVGANECYGATPTTSGDADQLYATPTYGGRIKFMNEASDDPYYVT